VVFVYFWRSGAAVSWRCACECSYVSMNIHVFLENSQEHQEDDEQCGGDNCPPCCVFVGDLLLVNLCILRFVGDLLPILRTMSRTLG
jgi:hypothetical protein